MAVLGAAASGLDIGVEIASVASKVYICHDKPVVESALPNNVTQRSGIKEFDEGAKNFVLKDGSVLEVE